MTLGLLGVFGCMPAFDNFCRGLKTKTDQGTSASLRVKRLRAVGKYYAEHRAQIDAREVFTLDFSTESESSRRYPAAKIIVFRKAVDKLQGGLAQEARFESMEEQLSLTLRVDRERRIVMHGEARDAPGHGNLLSSSGRWTSVRASSLRS
jgi:hypothetical protein